jgi:hypothetical protein
MPGFLSDMANRSGAVGTVKAVEREAQRRAEARRAQPVASQGQRSNQAGVGGSGAAGQEQGRRTPAESRP